MAVTHGVADTSVFVARETGRSLDIDAMPAVLGLSMITVGELRAGVLAAPDEITRERRLATFTETLALDPIPVDERVAAAWAKLRTLLSSTGQRMPINDSWIAATAMALDLPVVTQDEDYVTVPGLDVIKV